MTSRMYIRTTSRSQLAPRVAYSLSIALEFKHALRGLHSCTVVYSVYDNAYVSSDWLFPKLLLAGVTFRAVKAKPSSQP